MRTGMSRGITLRRAASPAHAPAACPVAITIEAGKIARIEPHIAGVPTHPPLTKTGQGGVEPRRGDAAIQQLDVESQAVKSQPSGDHTQ